MLSPRTRTPAVGAPVGSRADQVRAAAVGALWRARSYAHLDLDRDPASCVLLLGSAWSGTTWLGEVINRRHDYRVLFEPLRVGAVPALQVLARSRWLSPDDRRPEVVEPAAALLSGRLRDGWVDHTGSPLLPRKRLLKEIRGNCLAPWLQSAFPTSPLVLVVRHPVDVVRSRTALGWDDGLGEYLADGPLVAAQLADQVELLRGLRGGFARGLATWAIETAVPLRLLDDRALVVFHELLRDDPQTQLATVLRHVGQQADADLGAVAGRPSRTSRSGGQHEHPSVSPLTADERAQAADVLAAFDLDRLYDLDERRPDLAGLPVRPALTARPE